MKIAHVITALNVGGAETMLAKLVEHECSRDEIEPRVISLMTPGVGGDRIRASGVPLHGCGLDGALALPAALARLRAIIGRERPDMVMAWMYHAHLAAVLGTCLQGRSIPLIWNVRHSIADLSQEKPATRAMVRLEALLSRVPRRIIYNSHAAAQQHERLGFCAARSTVIPNGFDCAHFRPEAGSRERLVERLGIDPNSLIVGMAARNHPMKDPATLVEAVRLATEAGTDIHLLLSGQDMDKLTGDLAEALQTIPAGRVTLRGHDKALAECVPGLDLLVLPSAWGEGFPNILGEAMSCGVPCIATDVGDSRFVIGDTGLIVPPREPAGMAKAILTLAKLGQDGRRKLGQAARDRVREEFAMDKIGALYTALYDSVNGAAAQQRGRSQPAIHQAQVM
jgi:glycosyltransferase involved in cell wall biosynthesis